MQAGILKLGDTNLGDNCVNRNGSVGHQLIPKTSKAETYTVFAKS